LQQAGKCGFGACALGGARSKRERSSRAMNFESRAAIFPLRTADELVRQEIPSASVRAEPPPLAPPWRARAPLLRPCRRLSLRSRMPCVFCNPRPACGIAAGVVGASFVNSLAGASGRHENKNGRKLIPNYIKY